MVEIRQWVEMQEQGGVARIFLNRPEKSNAVNTPLLLQLVKVLEALKGQAGLRVVVLAGRGKAFCGGADVTELASLDAGNGGAFVKRIHKVCAALRALPVPVVAKLHGAVIGAGLEIAAACDLRVAAAGTKFAMPEVRLGIPSVVEAALLPRLIGWGRTSWLLMTGQNIGAPRALEWGLVETVVKPRELDAAIERDVAAIVAAAPKAVRAQKSLMRRWETLPLDEAIRTGIEAFAQSATSGEHVERMAAFVNRKRK
jgi:enoyl-CoA hydratase